jgi:hypothetical protein
MAYLSVHPVVKFRSETVEPAQSFTSKVQGEPVGALTQDGMLVEQMKGKIIFLKLQPDTVAHAH